MPSKAQATGSTKRRKSNPTSYSLSCDAREVIEALCAYYGLNRSALVEMLVRERGRNVGLLREPRPVD